MSLDATNLYGGISGVQIKPERFDLGEGIAISQTYAHFMAPFLMAFAPAAPGKPHPAPWRAAKGGIGVDITAEIYLPFNFQANYGLDRLNTIWLLTALLRLKVSSGIFAPVVSNEPLS